MQLFLRSPLMYANSNSGLRRSQNRSVIPHHWGLAAYFQVSHRDGSTFYHGHTVRQLQPALYMGKEALLVAVGHDHSRNAAGTSLWEHSPSQGKGYYPVPRNPIRE